MTARSFRRLTAAVVLSAVSVTHALAAGPEAGLDASCPAQQPHALVPTDAALCRSLAEVVREPAALPLGEYEEKLGLFLRSFCHRDTGAGWVRDKRVRDTGPYVQTLSGAGWDGTYRGTHAPVVIWYSPEMADWARENRTAATEEAPSDAAPVPAGAVMVKEMYPAPAERCAEADPLTLLPTSGAAVMVRAPEASQDGWFWGWFGWAGWDPDWPADNATNRLPYMGFGQYCTNCHASARDNLTFTDTANIQGEPGEPLVFLSQHAAEAAQGTPHHETVVLAEDDTARLGQPHTAYAAGFLDAFSPDGTVPDWAPDWNDVPRMPSETYDNVWMAAGPPDGHSQYLTSDQCLGCHDAGSTGLQFDMTRPATGEYAGKLLNLSPYGTWRTSPMGLAGRDPIFFAQMASETQTFHAESAGLVENTCLGCHGIQGQRQFGIDRTLAGEDCGTFTRDMVEAVPWPADNPDAGHADYGALARDGISCTSCHRMVLGEEATAANAGTPRNACVEERQALINPENEGFAKTFTGSYLVGPADALYGPFADPKTAPMETALGIVPEHSDAMAQSEVCGTCHTVHLPVLHEGETVGRIYEQLTYPEWAFSDYRTGSTVDGDLPEGPGKDPQSCQACHMPSAEPDGSPTVSRIASIQEYTSFPQAAFAKPAEEIDLPEREGFSRHTLVGLNVFLIEMAQQFPDVLGIRTQDPMLTTKGVDPLILTELQMVEQAETATAKLTVSDLALGADTLSATVTVENLAGHKFPSGVGFRRAFVTFEVLDRLGAVLWASGATDPAGRIVDASGAPIDGEVWWEADCSARIAPEERRHQPHFQTVSRQDQAQIYQELVSTPAAEGAPQCGHAAAPAGQLTTSFLSICAEVKDNRLLPHGFLEESKRIAISEALGAGKEMAQDAGSTAVGDDPDYVSGEAGASGRDSLDYAIPLADIDGTPAAVRVRLSYQATPPFYLQDRFCTAEGADRDRLYFLAGHLNLEGTPAEGWKLTVQDTGAMPLPAR